MHLLSGRLLAPCSWKAGVGLHISFEASVNDRSGAYQVEGQVRYGNVGHEKARSFRQHMVMNTEGMDSHLPTPGDTNGC